MTFITKRIKEQCTEIDSEKKINDNTYVREVRVFGVLVFKSKYTLRWTVKKPEEEKQIVFKTHQP